MSGAQSSEGGTGLRSVSSAGGSLKKRKALERKESDDTQQCESCHLNDMDEQFGCHEPKFKCDRQCWKNGVKYCGIASATVEDNEFHTMNFCKAGTI